jgi:hypothetical protein
MNGVRSGTLLALGAAASGYLFGDKAGEDLAQARATGLSQGRARAAQELTDSDRAKARRVGRKSGFKVAYRQAFRTTRARVAQGGPRNCGDVQVADTPSIGKVRAENISCAVALAFARDTRTCTGDTGTPCHGYTCTVTLTGYEESEFTCRRANVTIRYLSGV